MAESDQIAGYETAGIYPMLCLGASAMPIVQKLAKKRGGTVHFRRKEKSVGENSQPDHLPDSVAAGSIIPGCFCWSSSTVAIK